MKRAVVFAHYDKDNIVDDYVIYYIKALKKIAQTIVFVSCNNIKNPECLEGLVDKIIDEPHDEYDFGSYKRGFLFLQDKLVDYDELIFANDSCFGPLYPIENVFAEMENKNCDFWGITKNNFGYKKNMKHIFFIKPHVQSYFLVFYKNVFMDKDFQQFIGSIQHEEIKPNIIIKYEMGLSEFLVNRGFHYATFVNAYGHINNITVLKWRQILLKHKMPFMKCSLPRLANTNSNTVAGYKDILMQISDYPIELIEKNVMRTKVKEHISNGCPILVKRMFFDLIIELPFFVRKGLIIIAKRLFPFLLD